MKFTNWRAFFACVLIFAIPFQAIASTRTLACGPSHHRMLGSTPQPAGTSESAHHHSSNYGTHDRGNAHESALPQSSSDIASREVSSDDASSLSSVHHSAQSKCNSCAPCCTGLVLVGEFAIHIDNSALDADFPAVQPLHWPAHSSTFDRPPRNIAA